MTLDPQAKSLLDALAEAEGPPILEAEPEEVRQAMAALGALSIPEAVRELVDRTVPGPDGDIPVRIYTPDIASEVPNPGLVWYHGGGFVIGDLDTTDGVCRSLCNRAGVVVVSVDYRLAPEQPFPAAVDDAVAALDWVRAEATHLGVDPDRIAVGGDSAGGNLAAVVAQERSDDVVFQLLVYPTVDLTMSCPSIDENAEGYLLTKDHMTWFLNHYVGEDVDRRDPRMSPLFAEDLTGLPPAFVITAGYDPLRDEGEAYGERLAEAGVDVDVERFEGMIHAFFQMNGVIEAADAALDQAAERLRKALVS